MTRFISSSWEVRVEKQETLNEMQDRFRKNRLGDNSTFMLMSTVEIVSYHNKGTFEVLSLMLLKNEDVKLVEMWKL